MNPVNINAEKNLLVQLEKNPQKAITDIYRMYRDSYHGFISRYAAREEMKTESYHDAVLIFYDIYRKGKYDPENASIKTLIFAIGKKKLFQQLKKEKTARDFEFKLTQEVNLSGIQVEEEVWNENDFRLKRSFAEISESCRQILTLFYYHGYSIEAIRIEMDHANDGVTKSHKSRCLKKLKTIFKTIKG